MGISDENYGEALKRQRAFQVELMKLEIEKQKEERKMAGLMSSLGNLVGAGQQQALQPNGLTQQQAQQMQAANAAGAIGGGGGSGVVHISHGGTTTTFTGTGTGTTIGTATNTGTWGTLSQTSISGGGGLRPITEVDLKHDAMQAPLSALVDMWTVRWQGEWVNESEFDEDDFWRLALIRLMGANKLEKHNLANQYRSVYRIIE